MLVEGPAFDLPGEPALAGGDLPLAEERTYYRLRSGDLLGVYEPITWSEGYDYGLQAYSVPQDALLRHSIVLDYGSAGSSGTAHRTEVERAGLVLLTPDLAPTADEVHALARRHWATSETHGRHVAHPWWPRDAYRRNTPTP